MMLGWCVVVLIPIFQLIKLTERGEALAGERRVDSRVMCCDGGDTMT